MESCKFILCCTMVCLILLIQGEDDNNTCFKQTKTIQEKFQEKYVYNLGTNLVILLGQAVGGGGQLGPDDHSLLRDTEPSGSRSESFSNDGQLPHSRMATVFSSGSGKESGPITARYIGEEKLEEANYILVQQAIARCEVKEEILEEVRLEGKLDDTSD